MTFVVIRKSELQCEGCGMDYYLEDEYETATELRKRAAQTDGWTYSRKLGDRCSDQDCQEGKGLDD